MDQLGIFAKYWQPGAVKTRLAQAIGPSEAAEVSRAFLLTLLARLSEVGDRRVLAFSPADRREDFASLAPEGWTLAPQGEGDLGRRMRRYFSEAAAAGARRVVLLGSDSPTVPIGYIRQAFGLLDRRPVVLGPTTDGGYYLVGTAGGVPPIFDAVAWGTPSVWDQTIRRLRQASIPVGCLPQWYDVDDRADLARLRAELDQLAREDDSWNELLKIVEQAGAGNE